MSVWYNNFKTVGGGVMFISWMKETKNFPVLNMTTETLF